MKDTITIRRSEYEQLLSVIAELRGKVQQLQEEIELLKNGRNSKTSSTAPSHDISRSNVHSLHRTSGKKTGGQKGHPGHHLSMSDTPDTVTEHIPERCSCGHSLEGVTLTGQTRRQVIDIPPIKPHYTEHRSYHKICPCCGMKNRGVYPDEVSSPVQYGRGIKSMVSYLSAYQFLPYKRLSVFFRDVTPAMMDENRRHIKAGNPSMIPGDRWAIHKITNIVHVPNQKTDANNRHDAFISTDLPEENWSWPTSSWEWRDKFANRLRSYTEGLFWFAQNDPELPANFRKEAKEWGLAKDEYADNEHFPRQVYVREGRRFEGLYFFTANDAIPVQVGSRPPIHQSSITAGHYALDSHAVRKREAGRVHLDGFLSYPAAVYTVPYGVMVSGEVDNLLFPVPVSGSHIGFSTLRMEPCWMALGQAAGIASSIAIDEQVKVQNVSLSKD